MADAAEHDDTSLEGTLASFSSTQARDDAMDQAFDYRGDVTIETTAGKVVEGYVFDRRNDQGEPYVRVMPADGSDTVSVQYVDIVTLTFTGRDTAAGKSWETWVKKYSEKKQRGEAANIASEPLDAPDDDHDDHDENRV